MKHALKSVVSILGVSLVLCACAPVQREVPFNESAFTSTLRSGSEFIQGQAFTILKNGSRRMQEHGSVLLMPKNSYTTEIVQKEYNQGLKLTPPDLHLRKYVRETVADVNGNFIFHNVAPGQYYVASHIKWYVDEDETDADGNSYTSQVPVDQWIWDDVTVRKGDSREIVGWDQGK